MLARSCWDELDAPGGKGGAGARAVLAKKKLAKTPAPNPQTQEVVRVDVVASDVVSTGPDFRR